MFAIKYKSKTIVDKGITFSVCFRRRGTPDRHWTWVLIISDQKLISEILLSYDRKDKAWNRRRKERYQSVVIVVRGEEEERKDGRSMEMVTWIINIIISGSLILFTPALSWNITSLCQPTLKNCLSYNCTCFNITTNHLLCFFSQKSIWLLLLSFDEHSISQKLFMRRFLRNNYVSSWFNSVAGTQKTSYISQKLLLRQFVN